MRIGLALVVFGCDFAAAGWNSPSIDGAPTVDLSGDKWRLSAWEGPGAQNCSSSIACTVPGDLYTDLWKAEVIGDPMEPYGDHKTAWAGRTSWSYKRHFAMAQLESAFGADADVLLVAEGLETNATVLVNGVVVMSTDDMWVQYMAPITKLLQPANNSLEIRFHSVYDECEFSNPTISNRTCPNRVYIRQSASSWGWDWVNRYSPQGIWRPIYFIGIKPRTAAITSLSTTVRPLNPGARAGRTSWSVEARVMLQLRTEQDVGVEGTVRVCGDWAGAVPTEVAVNLTEGTTEMTLLLKVQAHEVKLWWPLRMGQQYLYNLTATFTPSSASAATSTARRSVGFRTVRLQTDFGQAAVGAASGSGNESMIVVVNDQRVLLRGSSLVPFDTFNGRVTQARAFRLLNSTASANMNALRVWGGGTFLPTAFMEEADRIGIMLLHDFMLSWYPGNPYPAYPAFRERITVEATQQFKRLSRHPSIVMWFGGNEDQCTRYDPSRSDGCQGKNWYHDCAQVFADCKALYIDTVLDTAARFTSVPLWPVSPSAGWSKGVDRATGIPLLDKNFNVGQQHIDGGAPTLVEKGTAVSTLTRPLQGALDVHGPYSATCVVNRLSNYYTKVPEQQVLFHSEFGQLSFPQFESIRDWAPDSSDWSAYSQVMNEKSPQGAEKLVSLISATLGNGLVDFKNASEISFRRVIFLSQLAASECLRVTVDGGRLGQAGLSEDGRSNHTTRPWGYLYWQLNDVGAFNSWGSLEYSGRLKLPHYSARRTFGDVRVECNALDPPSPGLHLPLSELSAENRIVCSAANDHPSKSWNGSISLAAGAITAPMETAPDWSQTFSVANLAPGTALRFFSGTIPGATRSTVARWLYGLGEHNAIGLPLLPLKTLVDAKALPAASVTVRALPSGLVAHVRAQHAAAFYVYVTTACLGSFSTNAIHLRAGESRAISFDVWEEGGTCEDFAGSLHVQWLNMAGGS